MTRWNCRIDKSNSKKLTDLEFNENGKILQDEIKKSYQKPSSQAQQQQLSQQTGKTKKQNKTKKQQKTKKKQC